jgi:hypothetical protein
VNADLTPAIIVAGGGSALMGGIYAREYRAAEAMRASQVRLGLRFPIGLAPGAALAALEGLAGLPESSEVIVEVAARTGLIQHALWVPEAVRPAALAALHGTIPSLRASAADGPTGRATASLKLYVPNPVVLQAGDATGASRSLLAGLATLQESEEVVVRWALRPGAPLPRPETKQPDRATREADQAWRRKASLPGMYAEGLILVRAASVARARELCDQVASVIRSRRSSVGYMRLTSERGGRSLAARPQVRRRSGWLSCPELLALLGWPLGPDIIAGVEQGASRELPTPAEVAREGRPLFIGREASGERPVALTPEASLHHLAVVGPSGVGKSALIARGILSDIERGVGGVAIDPKGDLLDTVLDRVKPERAGQIVVLDPGDASRLVPGIDVLGGGDPDLRTDVLVGTLKSIFPDWGIRSETYGRLGLRTLGEVPGATLADLGRLFADEPYRRAAITRLRDPFLISSWQSYEALSPAAQADVIQAPMARVMTLLSRPRVRAVVASPDSKLDIARLFGERKFLLVSLAPGALGEAGAALIGSAVMYTVWSAIEARIALPPQRRHLLSLYVDELATVTNGLPSRFELIAERARGLGASLTVAAQTLGRIPEPTRSALLGNVASFITFRAGYTEAPQLAGELPGLSAADLMALDRFHVAARIGTGAGASVAVVTGRTEPLRPETGQAKTIRDASARLYGSDPAKPSTPTEPPSEGAPLGQKRRPS